MNLREEFEKKWPVDMNQIFDESIGKYIPPHRTHELNIRWEAFQYAHELFGKDAERWQLVEKLAKPGARHNGQVVNALLLDGHRDKNRMLFSFILRDEAADVYAAEQKLAPAIDAAMQPTKGK